MHHPCIACVVGDQAASQLSALQCTAYIYMIAASMQVTMVSLAESQTFPVAVLQCPVKLSLLRHRLICLLPTLPASPARVCTHSHHKTLCPPHELVGVLHALQVTVQTLAVCQRCFTAYVSSMQWAMLCAADHHLGIASSPLLKHKLIYLLYVLQVTMQTLADSELGVSRYPIFSYDSRGGGGLAKGTDTGQQHRRPQTSPAIIDQSHCALLPALSACAGTAFANAAAVLFIPP